MKRNEFKSEWLRLNSNFKGHKILFVILKKPPADLVTATLFFLQWFRISKLTFELYMIHMYTTHRHHRWWGSCKSYLNIAISSICLLNKFHVYCCCFNCQLECYCSCCSLKLWTHVSNQIIYVVITHIHTHTNTHKINIFFFSTFIEFNYRRHLIFHFISLNILFFPLYESECLCVCVCCCACIWITI